MEVVSLFFTKIPHVNRYKQDSFPFEVVMCRVSSVRARTLALFSVA